MLTVAASLVCLWRAPSQKKTRESSFAAMCKAKTDYRPLNKFYDDAACNLGCPCEATLAFMTTDPSVATMGMNVCDL